MAGLCSGQPIEGGSAMADEPGDAFTQILSRPTSARYASNSQASRVTSPRSKSVRSTQAVMADQLTGISIRLANHSLTLSDIARILDRRPHADRAPGDTHPQAPELC